MTLFLILIGLVILICVWLNHVTNRIGVPTLLAFIVLGIIFGNNGLIPIRLEDMDFAVRMNRLGRSRGQKWGTLKGKLITSSRKFDQFGDWYLIKNRKITKRIFTGRDREAANQFYYDAR